ncbi:MAG: GNAT family N-acetyltransferase [Lachnospiraceae bacterium]|jgi:GNAT superfamily N-acetyltransferase|nr:GNAT family N-acetyltransferase [Lachnospiraceae bacterium]
MIQLQDTLKAEILFQNEKDTVIWSCLQKVMGEVYADDPIHPRSAMAILGDFCFFAGEVNKDLIRTKPKNRQKEFIIMVPGNKSWSEAIQDIYGEKAKKVIRYAIKKEGDRFDRTKLESAVAALPSRYTINMIDRRLYNWCFEHKWSRDFVSNYKDYEMFEKIGIGAVVCEDGIPVSGASSYSSYKEGIEIEIVTKEEYRRQGLAYCCAAKLILECLKRGWYPSWDAQNRWSVGLAEKLGYHFDSEYEAYEVTGYGTSVL